MNRYTVDVTVSIDAESPEEAMNTIQQALDKSKLAEIGCNAIEVTDETPLDEDGDEVMSDWDEQYERQASRARLDDFAATGGKDWT